MRGAHRAARIAPVAGLRETLHVRATIAAHPRRPGVAEGVEADERQRVLRRLPAGRPALRAGQAKEGELRAQQQMLEVSAVIVLEQPLALVVLKVLRQRTNDVLAQLEHA